MIKKAIIFIIVIAIIATAFLNNPIEIPKEVKDHIPCQPEQRQADACIEIFQPVCGLIDTNIRCITEPCPSSERKTFSNNCHACRDKNVLGYTRGECN